jgi:hypothetical protein
VEPGVEPAADDTHAQRPFFHVRPPVNALIVLILDGGVKKTKEELFKMGTVLFSFPFFGKYDTFFVDNERS